MRLKFTDLIPAYGIANYTIRTTNELEVTPSSEVDNYSLAKSMINSTLLVTYNVAIYGGLVINALGGYEKLFN